MVEIEGVVRGVYVALQAGSFLTRALQRVEVTFEGMAGDVHAGLLRSADSRTPFYPRGTRIRNARQVSLVSTEDLAETAAELGVAELLPEWLGANVLAAGIPHFSLLPSGTRLFFQSGAVLIVYEENNPCKGPGRILQEKYPERPELAAAFVNAARHRRGVVGWVELPGAICTGDRVTARLSKAVPYPGL